jgi:predicted nucleic acid-binding protein
LMARVLLDTTVLIDVLRGRPAGHRLRRLREFGDQPCVCAINVEEVVRGLRGGEEETTRLFLDGFRVVRLGAREGWQAGEWRRSYAARGMTLGQGDALIAAAALTIGGRLATCNPHDFPMPELTVEHWPVGA